MKPTILFRLVLLFCLLGLDQVHAALEWSEKEISLEVQRGKQEEVRAKYEFKNTGKKTLTIQGVTTSCGCTVATLESSTVAPGQKSSLHTVFTIGNRHGQQEKKITITTDDPENPETVLTLKVNLIDSSAERT